MMKKLTCSVLIYDSFQTACIYMAPNGRMLAKDKLKFMWDAVNRRVQRQLLDISVNIVSIQA
jgi:hypothetical protein